MFCNENTEIAAALKHHHHPLKYLANSYFGQGGREACLSASGKHAVHSPWAKGRGAGILAPKPSCPKPTKCFLRVSAVPSPQKRPLRLPGGWTGRSVQVRARENLGKGLMNASPSRGSHLPPSRQRRLPASRGPRRPLGSLSLHPNSRPPVNYRSPGPRLGTQGGNLFSSLSASRTHFR